MKERIMGRMFNIRDFPDEWRIRLKVEAAIQGVTIGKLLIEILDYYFRNHRDKDKVKDTSR